MTIKVPNRTRARRYSGQEFYKSFEKYKVWKLTILARLGGMLCVFNCLARLGVCCVFSIAFLDFYAQHVYNSTPILTSLRSLDLNYFTVQINEEDERAAIAETINVGTSLFELYLSLQHMAS